MRRFSVWAALLSLLVVGQRADAQELGQDRAPRFLVASSARTLVPVDVKRTPVLARRIALDLDGVTLKEALVAITTQAALDLFYSDDAVPLERRVHLRAQAITVAAALTDVLLGVDVDVVFSPNGRAALVRRGTVFQTGTVTGVVTDSASGQGVSGVAVFLDRTRWRGTTDEVGRYRLTDVTPGPYTLVARRIGYKVLTRPVTVEAEREVEVNVALQAAPSELEAVVVTATGEQRLLELGHVVGRINADSLVRETPVTSLSELLTGRVPGLQVTQTQGSVGGRVQVRIRGPNSLTLGNEPIVIIDGVRYTTQERSALFDFGPGALEPTSPLNDITVNNIESIEVVKGPSAATLYGTDAANGVIVVTTRRGQPGPARWNAYAKGTINEVPPQRFPDIYWGWGSVLGGGNCNIRALTDGRCSQQDSITKLPNPLNDEALSLFGSKPGWEYGLSVAGGQGDLRYFMSADFVDATGPLQMPRALAEQLMKERGLSELPEEWRNPNAFTKLSLRSNVTAVVGDKMDLRLSTGYVKSATRSLPIDFRPYSGAFAANPTRPGRPYGTSGFSDPAQQFAQTSDDRSDRFLVSGGSDWRPTPWLAARATLGMDLINTYFYALVRPEDQPGNFFTSTGAVEDTRSRQLTTTADLGVTVIGRRGRVSARTAVGAQYVRNLLTRSGSFGTGLPPGAEVVQRALDVSTSQMHEEDIVLGGYVEEMLGLNDRLFLTGALRVDGASSFGRDFQSAVYPKAGASWLVSREPFMPAVPGLDELRLRYAFGASGKQPNFGNALPGFLARQIYLDGQRVNVVDIFSLGNPDLRPEKVREHEFGFDATGLGGRLQLDATWFRRRTVDQINFFAGAPGMGGIFANLGLTTQRGFEAQLRARILDTRRLSWDLTLQHADYRTKLVDLGGGFELRSDGGGYVEGYPLGARFITPFASYTDANGDGMISLDEMELGTQSMYFGESAPPRSQTLTTVLGLFGQRLRLSALLERRSGFTQINGAFCSRQTCLEAVDPSTPLEEQARAQAFLGPVPEKADFTRLREVAVALDLPASLTRAVGVGRSTLVVSARNLALWTDFSGPDPESGTVTRTVDPINAVGGSSGTPQSRVFSVRLDVGF